MGIVTGTFSLNCDKCGNQHDFTASEADFEANSGSERKMGPESVYAWEHTINCDECENVIDIEYRVWEYPVGAFNDDDVTINGKKHNNRFGYDFHNAPEPEDI
jgi:hypothetical protein